MALDPHQATTLLRRAVENDRSHGAYLLSGDVEAAGAAAVEFARALVCTAQGERPCGSCRDCDLSGGVRSETEPVVINGKLRKDGGEPHFRHVGDHPDLRWVERGPSNAQVTIHQIRTIQKKLHRSSSEGGRKIAVIAETEGLSIEVQNALLRILEEPPPETTLLVITRSAVGLLATIRSRCVRAHFPPALRPVLRGEEADPEVAAIAQQLDGIATASVPDLLDWAEGFRGDRATGAEQVQQLLSISSEWLRQYTVDAARDGHRNLQAWLDAFRTLQRCRADLAQYNANPQMVAERALTALHSAAGAAR